MLQKRYTPLFLVMLGLFLAACNQGTEEKRIRFGFSQCFDDHPFRSKMNDEMRVMAALYPNVELIIKEARGSHDKQVGHVDSFIEEGLDVIIVSPLKSDSLFKNKSFCIYRLTVAWPFWYDIWRSIWASKKSPDVSG